VSEIERLRNHWLHNYDWRVHEAKINELPQFTVPIDVDEFGEMTIHFVHQKSNIEGAIPLIFVHGWPGSFYEVHKILPLLTQPKNGEQAFHVVAPRYSPGRIVLTRKSTRILLEYKPPQKGLQSAKNGRDIQ